MTPLWWHARERLQLWLPRLVLSPSVALCFAVCLWLHFFTAYLSFSDSRLLPSYGWVGFENYISSGSMRSWEKIAEQSLDFCRALCRHCHCFGPGFGHLPGSKNSGLRGFCAQFISIPWRSALS